MITRTMEIIRHRLGWCPNAQVIRASPAMPVIPAVAAVAAQPGGGTGGSGRIDRGARLAIGSIRILFRNKRLLWFSLLSGIVMVFSLASTLSLEAISGPSPFTITSAIVDPGTILIARGSLLWIGLTLATALISTFLTIYLLAGLLAYVSHIISGSTITIREALVRAGNHMRTLTGWAAIGAIAGTALTFILNSYPGDLAVVFISLVATFIFGILTMFVVPAIVLEDERLVPAIRTSVSVFQRTLGEIIICAGIFFLIVFAMVLIAVVPIAFIGFSSGNMAMAGIALVLYLLVMMVIMFIGSTIVGIATMGLFKYGTTNRLPDVYREYQEIV
nr:DUF6159 family protein [uncultured Methanoregula sp.]